MQSRNIAPLLQTCNSRTKWAISLRRSTHLHTVTTVLLVVSMCIHLRNAHTSTARLSDASTQASSQVSNAVINLGWRADFNVLPAFCEAIMKHPQPFNRTCHRNSTDMTCDGSSDGAYVGKHVMFSQFRQDYYLYTRHFQFLKRRGVYLDIATNDPISISNTYFMDRCLRWSGVCVEANGRYLEKITRYRSCQIIPTCVMERDGRQVRFFLHGGAGGVDDASNKHVGKWRRLGTRVDWTELRCTQVSKVLDRSGVDMVDYLSLDVEGAELQVLQGIDWARTRIHVMTIEVRSETLVEIEQFLVERGYLRHYVEDEEFVARKWAKNGMLVEDVVFMHESVQFGSPE